MSIDHINQPVESTPEFDEDFGAVESPRASDLSPVSIQPPAMTGREAAERIAGMGFTGFTLRMEESVYYTDGSECIFRDVYTASIEGYEKEFSGDSWADLVCEVEKYVARQERIRREWAEDQES